MLFASFHSVTTTSLREPDEKQNFLLFIPTPPLDPIPLHTQLRCVSPHEDAGERNRTSVYGL